MDLNDSMQPAAVDFLRSFVPDQTKPLAHQPQLRLMFGTVPQADLQGSAAFRYRTADEWEAHLLTEIRILVRDSARLAKAEKGSEAAVLLRDRVDDEWAMITRDLAVLRAQERREARLAVRDTLHTRLASFYEDARSAASPVALLTWENTFKAAMNWLAHWNGSGR